MPRAAVLTAPRTIELQDRPALTPGIGEAFLQIEHAGICGTDLALYSGDYPVPLPLVCGHEFVGTVTAVGEHVSEEWIGQRVCAEINNTCLAYRRPDPCSACLRHLPNHCQKRSVSGIIQHDGAFAEEMVVPAGALHRLPQNLDPLTATLTEPLAAALQTFVQSPGGLNDVVVVLGPGRLGILITFVAALKGLKTLAVSRSPEKRERALKFGAHHVCAPEEADAVVREWTDGFGADIVVESTGTPKGLEQAMKLVRPNGMVAAKTTCGLPSGGVDLTQLVVDEIRIQGSRCGPFQPALDILSQHQDKLKSLITSVQPLENISNAIESAVHEDKVVLSME